MRGVLALVALLAVAAAGGPVFAAPQPVDPTGFTGAVDCASKISAYGYGSDRDTGSESIAFEGGGRWTAIEDEGYRYSGTWADAGAKELALQLDEFGEGEFTRMLEDWLWWLGLRDATVIDHEFSISCKVKVKDGVPVSLKVKMKGTFIAVSDGNPRPIPGNYMLTGKSKSKPKAKKTGFRLLSANVVDRKDFHLNETVVMRFSSPLDPNSVRPDTIRIRRGPEFGMQARGMFLVTDDTVTFFPALPNEPDLSDGAFQPGETWRLVLPGGLGANAVQTYTGQPLAWAEEFEFSTRDGLGPPLYIDNFLDPAPPAVIGVTPPDNEVDVLASTPVILTFNLRPVDPSTVTTAAVELERIAQGGVPVSEFLDIDLHLVQSLGSVVLRVTTKDLLPLPDNSTYRLTATGLSDLVGEPIASFVSTFTVREEP